MGIELLIVSVITAIRYFAFFVMAGITMQVLFDLGGDE